MQSMDRESSNRAELSVPRGIYEDLFFHYVALNQKVNEGSVLCKKLTVINVIYIP